MVGFGRMNGRTIGIVGNQPTEAAGKNHLSLPEKCGMGKLVYLSPSLISFFLVLMSPPNQPNA